MRKLLFILLCSALYFGQMHAASTQSEEELCFEILTNKVQLTYNVNLAYVEYEDGNFADFSTYNNFKNYTVENPNQSYLPGSGLNLFSAKRNHIGTIKANGDYILSQFAGFGNDTNFTFPLKSENDDYNTGDEYPEFKQNIVYTHHLLDGTFVSCGYLNVSPKGTHHLQSIAQTDYKTNTFEGSGFELLESSLKKEGINGEEEFLVGKVSISADDYSDKDLFKIKLLTVAYNNSSSYFNEFETFPKSVSSMTNPDAQSDGMASVMRTFLNKVQEETCLGLVHTESVLPTHCGGSVKSLSFLSKLISFFIPSAYAKIPAVNNYKSKMEEARGLVIYDGFPLDLHDKIMQIKDENLKRALLTAILPNFKNIINHKVNKNIVLTPYENVFNKCKMSYTDRLKNVKQFMKKLDVNNIDYNNFEYLDKKFGNCVIPYPDKSQLGKNIEGSFSAIEVSSVESSNNLEYENKYAELIKLENEFNAKSKLNQEKINKGELISNDEIKQLNQEKIYFEKKHTSIKQELKDLTSPLIVENTTVEKSKTGSNILGKKENSIKNDTKTSFNLNYIIAIICILIGIGLLYIWIRKSQKS